MAWLRNLFGGARRYNNYHDDDNLQLPGGASGNGNGAASRPSSSGSHSNAQTSEFTSLLSMPKEPMTIRGLFVFDKWKVRKILLDPITIKLPPLVVLKHHVSIVSSFHPTT